MRLVSRSLCLCVAALCLLALVGGGTWWGCVRLDGRLTERSLRGFVRRILAESRDARWAEVRSVASRDVVDVLERDREEWRAEAQIRARNLSPGTWVLWIGTRNGGRYHMKVDDLSWRPLAPPWRRHQFRLTMFERLG
jgi:hypothetical protein